MRIERASIDDIGAIPTRLIGAVAALGVVVLWILLALMLSSAPSGTEQTLIATIAVPCLTGISWICLDMATDMALGRMVSRIRKGR